MKKGLEIDALAYQVEDIWNLLFTFYDEEENSVGFVNVDSRGYLIWDVSNSTYEEDIMGFASKINGSKIDNTVDKQLTSYTDNPNRWIKAKYLINLYNITLKTRSELEDEYNESAHL